MVMCLQVLVTEVEQEEEYLVNNLQKRMDKLHLEKLELEKTLEQQRRKVFVRSYVHLPSCTGSGVAEVRCSVAELNVACPMLRRWKSCVWSR